METGSQTTYSQMKRNGVSCALWLEKQGIRNYDVVGICTPLQPNDHIPVIATFLVGAIFNPWYHKIDLETARHLINLTQPKIMFSCLSALEVLRDAAKMENTDVKFVCFEESPNTTTLKEILDQSTDEEIEAYKPNNSKSEKDIAMILFSSGTTGMPKGIAHSCHMIKFLMVETPLMPAQYIRILYYSSLYWISGTMFFLQMIGNCKTRILHANFDPEATGRVIEKFKVEWIFFSINTMINFYKLAGFENHNLETLKFIFFAGATMGKELIEQLHRSLPEVFLAYGYGLTEARILTLQTDNCTKIESVGFAMPNVQIKIVDLTDGKALGPNKVGELCFKTPITMVGYYRNPTATQKMIDDEGWYHTGDEAYYMENGELFVIERLTEIINCQGCQISPSEIEMHLMSHNAVLNAAVVPAPHDLDLQVPMAFVKKMPGVELMEEELVQYSAALGEIKKLRGVKFLDEIPHVASGKFNRKLLEELAKAVHLCKN